MHADFQDLLALRDGALVDAAMRQHVSQCPQCGQEFAQLTALKDKLGRLPSLEPPATAWTAIRSRLPLQSRRGPSRAPLAALAASIMIAVLVLPLFHRASLPPVPVSTGQYPDSARQDLSKLVMRSQQLEAVLQFLPPRPQVERAGTSATIDELQGRIQWVDLQLSSIAKDELPQVDAQRLWSARVELMNSLVHVRYAEAAGNADRSEPSANIGAI